MQVEFEGQTYEFPDDATDDEIAAALDGVSAPAVAPEPPNALLDVGASFAAGVPRGAVETAMAPVTLGRMAEDGLDWLYDKGEAGVRALVGAEPIDQAARDELDSQRWSTQLGDLIFGAQDAVRNTMDENLYEPRTTAGEYAQTLGEFAVPGSLPSAAARNAPNIATRAARVGEDVVGNIVAPALLSETAGQMAEGYDYEGLARALGAVTGNVGTAGFRAYNAPEMVVRRATGDMTDQQWADAIALQNNQTGVRLTGPEAIAQATGGASALPNVQRVVEGSIDGRAATAPFFAARPGQVDTAVNNVLDLIAPQSPNPSMLGPRAAEAGQEVIDQTRQGINAQTRPLYQAAEPQLIPDAEFASIGADPRFQAGIERLRANPEIGPEYANLPDNAVGVVDAVTKDMLARGEAMATRANPLYGPEQGMRNTVSAVDARNTASRSSPEYAQALAEQEALRRTQLDPVQQGPVGRVAAANDTAGAGEAVLPRNPMTGAAGEQADAVQRLAAQDADTTAGLVRQNLGDRYARASTETQEGVREFTGAKFHKDVAGNDPRREVLDAVLGALPDQRAAHAMPELLDVLQATGRRKQIGSATEFNRSLQTDLGDASPLARFFGLARTLGGSILTNAGDATRRAALRRNLGTLADLFTDPQSVELLRNAANRGININLDEALRRSLPQGGPQIYSER